MTLGLGVGNIHKVIDCYDVKTWGIPVVCIAMTSIPGGVPGVIELGFINPFITLQSL
jgi:hypothetical protein